MKSSLIALLVLACLVGCEYTLYKHPIETGARCLDGTQAAIYYSIGSAANRNKFMIHFDSGGLCTGLTLADTLEDCYQRSFTGLGSSANYPPITSFPGHGLLQDDPQRNPVFYDWTKIYVPYCDGSEHQGSRLQPVSYKGRNLYFRGMNNSLQQFQYLNKTFGLYSADKVVLTGVSAGGMAAFQWSNYLYERVQNKQVFALPDSGVFVVDYVSPITGRANIVDATASLMKLTQSEVSLSIPECNADFVDKVFMCFSAGNLVKYLKAPFFIIESTYDEWAVINVIGLNCTGSRTPGTLTKCNATEIDAIEDYRRVTMQALRNLTTLKTVGIWSPSCIKHGFTDGNSFNSNDYRIPSGTGINLAQAVKAFLDNPTGAHLYIDDFGWPANKGCSGLNGRNIV